MINVQKVCKSGVRKIIVCAVSKRKLYNYIEGEHLKIKKKHSSGIWLLLHKLIITNLVIYSYVFFLLIYVDGLP